MTDAGDRVNYQKDETGLKEINVKKWSRHFREAAEIRFRDGGKWRIGERQRQQLHCSFPAEVHQLRCGFWVRSLLWELNQHRDLKCIYQCGLCRNFTDYLKRKQTLAPRSTHLLIHHVLCIAVSAFQIPHPENGILTRKHGGGSIMMCACRNTESAGRFQLFPVENLLQDLILSFCSPSNLTELLLCKEEKYKISLFLYKLVEKYPKKHRYKTRVSCFTCKISSIFSTSIYLDST